MKRILCVVDFSQSSGKVLDVAARIATACRAQVNVLYPYRLIDHDHNGDISSFKQKLEGKARDKFADLVSKTPGLSGTSFDFHPEIGFMSDRINAHLRRDGVDMVILGQEQADKESSLKGVELHDLIKDARLPFVIVPAEAKAEIV